jgi:hypothetical protein
LLARSGNRPAPRLTAPPRGHCLWRWLGSFILTALAAN